MVSTNLLKPSNPLEDDLQRKFQKKIQKKFKKIQILNP